MKVAHAEKHVLGSHGLTETKNFSIRTNAHAFKMLSSGLYSDKIAAVLREIGCNAFDAHVEKYGPNTDKPIVVKIPNRIDNQFYIRDYGPGLSHEDVMNLYTTYFASTKQNSNDYTGAFGLGSKSPFSYTDSFTVISVHNGVKRTYSAFIDNQGSPTIAKLTETPAEADWPHGVQIGFPVKPEDFSSFDSRAKSIFRWFRVIPKLEGTTPVVPVAAKYVDPQGRFEHHPGNTNGHRWAIVMGNVFYPVDLAKLNIAEQKYGRKSSLITFAHTFSGIVLKLKIGDVQIAASREEIQYDEASTKALVSKIEEALRVIGTDIANNLRTAKTWAERCEIKKKVDLWNGDFWGDQWEQFFKLIGCSDSTYLAGLIKEERVPCPTYMGSKSFARVVTPGRRATVESYTVKDGNWVDKRYGIGNNARITLRKNTRIFWSEQKNLAITRIKGLFARNEAEQVLLFLKDQVANGTLTEAKDEAKKVADHFGIPLVEDLSKISLPAGYTPSKKVYKKKGATLPPLPNRSVKVCSVMGGYSNHDISKLSASKQNFMVLSSGSGWGRSNRMRVYETTAEQDRMLEMHVWNDIWVNAMELAKITKNAPFDGYVELRANEVKSMDLVKRGWKPTYNVIKAWLEDDATRKLLAKEAENWMPSMSLVNGHGEGWAGEFVWLRHSYRQVYDKIEKILADRNISKQVEQIHVASVKQGSKAGLREPKVLVTYRFLAQQYQLQPITVTNKGTFITLDDFNKSIDARFPLTRQFSSHVLQQLCINHTPQKVEDFLKLVLS